MVDGASRGPELVLLELDVSRKEGKRLFPAILAAYSVRKSMANTAEEMLEAGSEKRDTAVFLKVPCGCCLPFAKPYQ